MIAGVANTVVVEVLLAGVGIVDTVVGIVEHTIAVAVRNFFFVVVVVAVFALGWGFGLAGVGAASAVGDVVAVLALSLIHI